jgi:hypothetical protein
LNISTTAIIPAPGACDSGAAWIASVSWYKRRPSSSGMPMSSAITYDGISPAMSVMKSHSPVVSYLATAASTMSLHSSVMRSVNRAAERGVNSLLMMRRRRVWYGGSAVSIILWSSSCAMAV